MVVFILFVLIGVPLIFIGTGIMLSAPKYKGPVTDHFDGKKFFTPGAEKPKGLKEVLRWMLNRKRGPWKENLNSNYGNHPLNFYKDGIRITFVNHTTFLIQADGLNILTDPVWSKRTSPFKWLGPKRMRLPGIKLEDLPKIHYILLSHNHYDHLDLHTLRIITGAHHPKIITPLGVKDFLDKEKILQSTDMDWWDEKYLSETVKVMATPAQHFSGRGTLDRDATLWCGYVLETSKGKIYFAGDTGYHPTLFKEIGNRLGGFKVSILPIGAYKPSWFMSPVHTSPAEAVKIHLDVSSELSIASHFGTFPLADDGSQDPIVDLSAARTQYGIAENEFVIPLEGEPIIVD